MTTLKQSPYKDYDKQVQDYMNNVLDCLKEDYKVIPSSWRIALDLIADNYDIYLKSKALVRKEGLSSTDSKGRLTINPSLKVMNTAQDKIQKLLSSFALTPMSKSKMKNLDTSADLYDELTE